MRNNMSRFNFFQYELYLLKDEGLFWGCKVALSQQILVFRSYVVRKQAWQIGVKKSLSTYKFGHLMPPLSLTGWQIPTTFASIVNLKCIELYNS